MRACVRMGRQGQGSDVDFWEGLGAGQTSPFIIATCVVIIYSERERERVVPRLCENVCTAVLPSRCGWASVCGRAPGTGHV